MNTLDSAPAPSHHSPPEDIVRVPETGAWFFSVQDDRGRRTWIRHPTQGDNPGDTWADSIRSLNHPSVPKLISVDSGSGVVEIEARDGLPLRHLLTHREQGEFALDGATVADLALRLFEPLASAHRDAVYNGRIGPDTVWVTQHGALAIWGWGEPDASTADPTWVSPTFDGTSTAEDDVWSAAALLLALAAGQQLRGRCMDPRAAKTVFGELLNERGGRKLADGLTRCLASDPGVRPTATRMAKLASAIERDASRLPRLGRVLAGGYAPRLTKRTSKMPKAFSEPLGTMPVRRPTRPSEVPGEVDWTPPAETTYETLDDPSAPPGLRIGVLVLLAGLGVLLAAWWV